MTLHPSPDPTPGRRDDGVPPFEAVLTLVDAAMSRVGLDPATAVHLLAGILSEPWHAYRNGTSRSALAESGAPFELSVKLAAAGRCAIRYVVDTADHSMSLRDNAARYVAAAAQITGMADRVLEELVAAHLWDAPQDARPTAMHGVGVSPSGTRGSVYFPSRWLSVQEVRDRLPTSRARLPGPAEVIAYDFAKGALLDWKTYHWLAVDPSRPLRQHPDLAHRIPGAESLHDRLVANVPAASRPRCAFLQRKIVHGLACDAVFLFSRPWGFAESAGLAGLLSLLSGGFGVELTVLREVLQASRDCGVALHVGLVSVGGQDDPEVTFYLWPRGAAMRDQSLHSAAAPGRGAQEQADPFVP